MGVEMDVDMDEGDGLVLGSAPAGEEAAQVPEAPDAIDGLAATQGDSEPSSELVIPDSGKWGRRGG